MSAQSVPVATKYDWTRLSHLQLGRFAEYLAKMECTLYGLDVYTLEVDDKGIDFIIRKDTTVYYDMQVKAVRDLNYIFFHKDKFAPHPNLFAIVALFTCGSMPDLYLIPSTTWLSPNALFASNDYEDKKSKPEWGLRLSEKNLPMLEPFTFDRIAPTL